MSETKKALAEDIEQKLASIEAKPYDPENATPFGAEEVKLGGQTLILHNFNNFPLFIGYWRDNYPDLPEQPRKLYRHNYFEIFMQNKIPQIMEAFMTRFPQLYVELAKLDEIRRLQEYAQLEYGLGSAEYSRILQETSLTPEGRVERDKTYSTAYNTVMDIAKIINPELDVNLLHTEAFAFIAA